MDLPFDEIGEHLLRRYLIIASRIALQLLNREAVVDDVGMIDD